MKLTIFDVTTINLAKNTRLATRPQWGFYRCLFVMHANACDSCLPSLYILLYHYSDSSVSTSVYRKPSHSDKYLTPPPTQLKSSCVPVTPLSILYPLFPNFIQKNDKVFQAFSLNNYPKHILCHPPRPTSLSGFQNLTPDWKALWPCHTSGKFCNFLRHILASMKIWVCFKTSYQTVGQLLSWAKNRVLDTNKLNIVYHVPCADSAASYVDQTQHRLV